MRGKRFSYGTCAVMSFLECLVIIFILKQCGKSVDFFLEYIFQFSCSFHQKVQLMRIISFRA